MKLPPATDTYSRENTQTMRSEIEREDLRNLKRDAAEPSILITDSDTGETGKLTVESGVIIWTAL